VLCRHMVASRNVHIHALLSVLSVCLCVRDAGSALDVFEKKIHALLSVLSVCLCVTLEAHLMFLFVRGGAVCSSSVSIYVHAYVTRGS
jgi:hypothetical protein